MYNLSSPYIDIYKSSRDNTIVVDRILAPQCEDANKPSMKISSSLPKEETPEPSKQGRHLLKLQCQEAFHSPGDGDSKRVLVQTVKVCQFSND